MLVKQAPKNGDEGIVTMPGTTAYSDDTWEFEGVSRGLRFSPGTPVGVDGASWEPRRFTGTSGSSSFFDDFSQGFNGGHLGVMEGPSPSFGVTAGDAAREFWVGTKALWSSMSGADSVDSMSSKWQKGNYGQAVLYGLKSLGEAGSTVFGFGLTRAPMVGEKVLVNNLTIAANPANGYPSAIARGIGILNSRQSAVLELLPDYGSRAIINKAFGQRDLAALTAATGEEFALFSTGGRRLIIRGGETSVPVNPEMAVDMASKGWRWSAHTHPGFDVGVLRSSAGDRAVLEAMGGGQSSIFNSLGQRRIFTPIGDSLNGWTPSW